MQLLGTKADGQGGGTPRSTAATGSAPPQSAGDSFDDEPREPQASGENIPF
jgi:hypothetical protein